MILIYHANCFDGFTAAWAYKHFGEPLGPATLHAATYGEDPPYEAAKDQDVLMVDFSYKRQQLEKLASIAKTLIILDHHETARDALEGFVAPNVNVIFDLEHAGCRLMWDYVIRKHAETHRAPESIAPPRLIDYVEDRDLWRFRLEFSKEIAAAVSACPMTLEAWTTQLYEAIEHYPAMVVQSGRGIMAYQHQYGTKALAESRLETIGGFSVPTVNLPYMNCSEYVGRLLSESPAGTPFAAGYFRRRDGLWQFSLRSKEPFRVNDVAAQYGGGGHPQAAGFQVERLPWEESHA